LVVSFFVLVFGVLAGFMWCFLLSSGVKSVGVEPNVVRKVFLESDVREAAREALRLIKERRSQAEQS